MRILIANDDGIYSPGLLALAEVAREFADVRIYAPDVEQSSMGHAITHSRPLSLRRTPIRDFEAYRVNGTPADCVALGVHLWDAVDLVLSGINLGIAEPSLCLVNVNLPPEPSGLCWSHQSVRHYDGRVIPGQDPMGRKHFWLTVEPVEEVEEGTDRWAVERGLVSITPLRLDLTDHAELARVRGKHQNATIANPGATPR